MHPQLDLGLFTIGAYTFFTAAALVAAVAGTYWYTRRRGFKTADALLMLGGMGLAAFIGARLFNVIVNFEWYREDPGRIFSLTASGFSLYGGIVFAIAAGAMIARARKMPLLKFADTAAPFVGIGIALMRIGCFLNGCCFGKETALPWGVQFPLYSPAHIHQISENFLGSFQVNPVHPTQIYELIAALICTALSFLLIRNKKLPAGTAALSCAIVFSAFRWFNMSLRVLPYSETTLAVWYPLLYAAIIIVCGFLLIRALTRHKNLPGRQQLL